MDNHSIAQIKERLTYKLEPKNIKIDQQQTHFELN
jgi:hypothetical protein